MLFKFLVFSFVFYLIIRFISRFFVFSSGSQTNSQSSQYNGQQYNKSQKRAPGAQSVDKGLDQVEEAEFEDITEKGKSEENS